MPCRPAISSMSLGRAWVHKLADKLDQAHTYGFQGIELFFEDLDYYAKEKESGDGPEQLIAAAEDIRQLCEARGLAIVSLGPFSGCEGLKDAEARKKMFEKLNLWIKLAHTLGTPIIQIPSNFLSVKETTGNMDTIIRDLQEIADIGLESNISFAYECLCWGTHNDLWEQSWEIVSRVDRKNFGLCLDTFNIAGRIYADPTSPTGKTKTADEDIKTSVRRLIKSVDVKKIFYVEVVDAELLQEPLHEGHAFYDPSQPARMSWSRNCRLFYGEEDRGGYLPILPIVKALLEKENLGFEGWVSFELFNRSLVDPDPDTPKEHARRAGDSWKRLIEDVKFEAEPIA